MDRTHKTAALPMDVAGRLRSLLWPPREPELAGAGKSGEITIARARLVSLLHYVCSICDEAWPDRGEWELLEALQLSLELPAVFTEAWQRRIRRYGFVAALLAAGVSSAGAQVADNTTPVGDPQLLVERIQQEVAAIRGLPFKQTIAAASQSPEEFVGYLDERISELVPESISQHYGKIVRKLGLYRGEEIADFRGTMKIVMTSQAGAYYDPQKRRFYVLVEGLPELMLGVLCSHELYHGLQDQYFGLEKYIGMSLRSDDPAYDDDELLARQAVVEGEATYIMNLWMLKRMTNATPSRDVMANMVRIQSQMNMEQIRALLKQPQVTAMLGEKMQSSMEAAKDIPPFLIETMMGVYLKGLGFVFAVQEAGWSAVEKLYTEYPPQSTEQILHPEKWLARESPSRISWPDFAGAAVLQDWELLDEGVVGEFQWRIIFREHGLGDEADASAAGWDADRYAVFKRKDSDEMLLLLRTSWDSKAEAREFAVAYERLLDVKYADTAEATRVVQKGTDVFIVEGGGKPAGGSLLKVVRNSKKTRR